MSESVSPIGGNAPPLLDAPPFEFGMFPMTCSIVVRAGLQDTFGFHDVPLKAWFPTDWTVTVRPDNPAPVVGSVNRPEIVTDCPTPAGFGDEAIVNALVFRTEEEPTRAKVMVVGALAPLE